VAAAAAENRQGDVEITRQIRPCAKAVHAAS
jgi:hypothetical protein